MKRPPLVLPLLAAFAMLTNAVTPIFLGVSWLFVGARVAHAYIFTTTNQVLPRFYAFATAFAAVMLMWTLIGVQILINTFSLM